MYTRQQSSQLRQAFWTAFGKYMAPVPGSSGDRVNWINYKTGVKYIGFKMDANHLSASISIRLSHPDAAARNEVFRQFEQLKVMLEEMTMESWNWQQATMDEHGKVVSEISKSIQGVNIFLQEDWPAIISFFKPHIIALDAFWTSVSPLFE